MPREARCPICGRGAAPRQEPGPFPFCSDRCRLVDLGRWLGEEYRIPGQRPGDGAVPAPEGEESDA